MSSASAISLIGEGLVLASTHPLKMSVRGVDMPAAAAPSPAARVEVKGGGTTPEEGEGAGF